MANAPAERRFCALTSDLFARIGADLPSELVKRLIALSDASGDDVTSVVEDALRLHLDACERFDPSEPAVAAGVL